MAGPHLLSTVRLIVYLVVLGSLIWKYRANKAVAFGVITIGCAALALLLGMTPGVPDWIEGLVVAIFLIMSLAMIPIVAYEVMRRRKTKINAPYTSKDDVSNSATMNHTNS